MSQDEFDREEERDFDPGELKKRTAFDPLPDEDELGTEDEFHPVRKVAVDEDEEEGEDDYAFYDGAEENSDELYSF